MKSSKVQILVSNQIPLLEEFGSSPVFIVDQEVLKKNKAAQKWFKDKKSLSKVKAGESLKELKRFPLEFSKIASKIPAVSRKELSFVAVGGGSVGDFSGFLASIYQRGAGLVQMPTTWLAAVDSAHGGKTALNGFGVKNQLGTFYPAHKVILCQKLLESQTPAQVRDGASEFFKAALLTNQPWGKQFLSETQYTSDVLWTYLPQAIKAKYTVIDKDPFEQKGIRYQLNLGHTLGHIIEAYYKISHGQAVALGLAFTLRWSFGRGLMKESEFDKLMTAYHSHFGRPYEFIKKHGRIPLGVWRSLAQKDKKQAKTGTLHFVFLKKRGQPFIEEVSLAELLKECQREGWVK